MVLEVVFTVIVGQDGKNSAQYICCLFRAQVAVTLCDTTWNRGARNRSESLPNWIWSQCILKLLPEPNFLQPQHSVTRPNDRGHGGQFKKTENLNSSVQQCL